MADTEAVCESLMDTIDEATEPSKMSKAEAVDVLEEIQSQIYGRLESLKEEMGEAEEEK